jgi:DNA replication protein DnaC
MSIEPVLLDGYLKELRLPAFRQYYAPFAEDASRANQSYPGYLLALAQQEITEREQRRVQQRIRAARFPVLKELADFRFAELPGLNRQRIFHLAQGDYIAKAQPIILVGNPGLGKTHIATGLALAACRQQQRVRFYHAAGLVNDLIAAQEDHRLDKLIAAALRHHLLVIDELGFIPFSPLGAQLIFQFCSALQERVALILTTNLKFADWTQVFGSEKLTLALLDRLTHHAHILEFIGESYRFKQRLNPSTFPEVPHDLTDLHAHAQPDPGSLEAPVP